MTVKCGRCYKEVKTPEPALADGLAVAQGIAAAGTENLTVKELQDLIEEVAGHEYV